MDVRTTFKRFRIGEVGTGGAWAKMRTPWSDVDIAAWGIQPRDTFRAIGMVMDLDAEIELNLVDVGACSASLLATIEREGVAV